MDGSAFNRGFGNHVNGSTILWIGAGIPALLAWLAFGLAILLDPHLNHDLQPLVWALYGAASWYVLIILVFGGWLGLLLVTAAI
ncbi:MAG: hypothetical protein AAGI12_08045 [Pseudomonadota bacterium]